MLGMSQPVRCYRLPLTPYETAWHWQREAAESVRRGESEALALLQHPPVYTFGRRVRSEHLLQNRDALQARGAQVIESDRGGDMTFHGPGQLVAYPILDLRRRNLGATDYVRALEAVMIEALHGFDIPAQRISGRPGVWTSRGKIGAIGVRIQGGVSMHGFALNIDTDLAWFDAIVACGLADATVTSMQHLLGAATPNLETVRRAIEAAFQGHFEATLQPAEQPPEHINE